MFPALVALGAAYFPTRAIGIAALTLAAFNLPYQANLVAESRALAAALGPVYAGAGTDGAGCQPRGPTDSAVGRQAMLDGRNPQRGTAAEQSRTIEHNNLELAACLRSCFCDDSAVMTDDSSASSRAHRPDRRALPVLGGRPRFARVAARRRRDQSASRFVGGDGILRCGAGANLPEPGLEPRWCRAMSRPIVQNVPIRDNGGLFCTLER